MYKHKDDEQERKQKEAETLEDEIIEPLTN